MSQTECCNLAKKVDEKMGSCARFSCFLPELWSLNCPNKCKFCVFCVDLSTKSKSVAAIYLCPSESSHYTLSHCRKNEVFN